ncbi:MAG: taurine ABC transporter substrate-binding protein [Alphaproteobacteria bacterium]|nr:taurine ABC transporter substrate-binding protein [Alphaproteobacteria bacterium]
MKRCALFLATALVSVAAAGGAWAQAKKELTFAHQDMMNPLRVAMVNGEVEKTTGYKVNWKQFAGGGDVIKAMASGDVAIGEAGSSPIAAAVSQGIDVELFWILEDIADAEALVVRNGSGINAPQDLKGKKLAVPFVSTTHFHALFALEQFGIPANAVQVINLRPPEIAAAWERGDLDATFIWDPVLAKVKKNGKVLIASGLLSSWGKATFDGLIVQKKFAKEHPDFMVGLVKVLAANDAAYVKNKAAWDPKSPQVAAVAKITGAKPEDVPAGMALYGFPDLAAQASATWLGGGKDGGAAKALAATSAFLKDQKRIDKLLPDYGAAVNPAFVQKAMGK